MVLGFDTPYHLVALVASLLTSIGILIIFANVMLLIHDRDGAVAHPMGAASSRAVVTVALLGALLIAGCAIFLLIAAR